MNSQRDDYFKNSRHDTASKSVCAFKIKFKSIQKNSYFKNGRHLSVNKSVDLSKLMLNPKQRASTKYEKTSHLYQLFDKGKHSYWHVNKLYKYIRQSGKESDNKKMSITDYASQTHLKREPAFALSQHNYSLNPSISERRNAWLTNKRKSIRLTFSSLKKITEIISSPVANMKMAGIAKVGLSNKQKEKSDTFEENNRMWSDFPLQGKIFRKSSPGNFTDLSDGAVKVTNAFITNSIKGNVVNLLKITEAMKSEIKKELNKTVINNNKQLIKEIHKQSQADAASSVKSITDDSTVRILMEKMRLLDREERFRVGLIK